MGQRVLYSFFFFSYRCCCCLSPLPEVVVVMVYYEIIVSRALFAANEKYTLYIYLYIFKESERDRERRRERVDFLFFEGGRLFQRLAKKCICGKKRKDFVCDLPVFVPSLAFAGTSDVPPLCLQSGVSRERERWGRDGSVMAATFNVCCIYYLPIPLACSISSSFLMLSSRAISVCF